MIQQNPFILHPNLPSENIDPLSLEDEETNNIHTEVKREEEETEAVEVEKTLNNQIIPQNTFILHSDLPSLSENIQENVDPLSLEEEDPITIHPEVKTEVEETEAASDLFPVIENDGLSVFTSCKEEETNSDTADDVNVKTEPLDEDNDYKEEYDDNFEVCPPADDYDAPMLVKYEYTLETCPPTDNSDAPMLVGHSEDNADLGLRRSVRPRKEVTRRGKYLSKFAKKILSVGNAFSCDECDYSSKVYRRVTDHIKFVHRGIDYPCDECNYTAAQPHTLRTHKEGVHSDTKYACDQCDYSGTKAALYAHKKRQHLGKKFKCRQCSFIGMSLRGLKKHKDNNFH